MSKKTYSELLLDPRWQKKRLKILERDKFRCRQCDNEEETLHVHHKKYNGKPWEAKDEDLVTLCCECHKHTETSLKEVREKLTDLSHLDLECILLLITMIEKHGFNIMTMIELENIYRDLDKEIINFFISSMFNAVIRKREIKEKEELEKLKFEELLNG